MRPKPRAFPSPAFALAFGVIAVGGVSGCRPPADLSSSAPEIQLVDPEDPAASVIEVTGISSAVLARLREAEMTDRMWVELLSVAVRPGGDPGEATSGASDDRPAMLGSYSVAARAVRFTPRFPLDSGREYEVTFDPSRLPSRRDMKLDRVVAVVSRPKVAAVPSTEIEQVYPTAEVWPQNQLRLYIHFSEPMGRRGGLDHVRVLGDDGREVEDLFLPLFDAQFWNMDRTRYTLFFDPGRVKRGLLPRDQLGPGLQVGRRYTLVVDEDWRDAEGLPLRAPYRKDFLVGPPAERPLNPQQWQLTPPRADTDDPLILTFPDPLDHGLLLRVLGVSRRDKAIDGEVRIEASETRWIFTPRSPWRRGDHQVIALSILEDGAGNRIGRAFEVAHVAAETHTSEPTATTIPFRVAP